MKELRVEESDLRKLFITDTPGARAWRTGKRVFKQLLAVGVLYLLFFFLLNFSAYWTRFEYTVNAQPVEKVVINPTPAPIIVPVDYKPEIQIPKLGVVAPLQLTVDPDLIVTSLNTGVAHYAGTALPGQVGNSVIVGHSSDFPWSTGQYKNVFALLDKLVAGDQIIIPYGPQIYIYEVMEQRIVPPTDLSVLRRSSEPMITLLTCYPVGSTRSRMIITARLVSNNASTVQTEEPFTGESLPRPR